MRVFKDLSSMEIYIYSIRGLGGIFLFSFFNLRNLEVDSFIEKLFIKFIIEIMVQSLKYLSRSDMG